MLRKEYWCRMFSDGMLMKLFGLMVKVITGDEKKSYIMPSFIITQGVS
jgi:hypothetical protein